MAVLPAEIPTGLVTGQFYFVSEDAADADTNPELEVVSGFVQFTASAKVLRMPSKRATIIPLTFNAKFDSEGHLVSASDPAIGIRLPATNSDLINPRDFTWKAEFFLKRASDETTIAIESFSFSVPVDGEVDLTEVMPVTEANGVPITQGLKGDKGDEGDAGPANSLDIGEVITGPTGTNAAAYITGESPSQTLHLTLPTGGKGDKGDTGNPLNAIPVPKGFDLDVGGSFCYNVQTTDATLALHYPQEGVGGIVLSYERMGTASGLQEYWPAASASRGSLFFRRIRVNTAWQPWKVYGSQRVDNTAGRAVYTWDDIANREQLIYGDSGWRDVTALVSPTYTATKVTLRRVGMQVTLNFDGLKSTTETGNSTFMNMPAGFGTDLTNGLGNLRYGLATELSGANPRIISPEPNSSGMRFLSYTTGVALHGSLIYYTRDPWPTSLPGTAVGTIPNA